MRRIIAAFRTSLDGFVADPNGASDWVDAWDDAFNLMPQIDTCVLGAGLFPDYERYWSSVLSDPKRELAETGKPPTEGELVYAKFAAKTPHIVLSRKLKQVSFPSARVVPNIEEIAVMKQQSGKDIYAVGGPTFVGSLMKAKLVDEMRLIIAPLILGGGKPLFKDASRRRLKLERNETLPGGQVRVTYVLA
jgi:dihydrofolate reductase